MNWSFSLARIFRQCQRQWYFKACLASAKAKDPRRREAYLLSKLQSVSAWRGNLVDQVISRELIGSLNRREKITKGQLLRRAKVSFDRQLKSALRHAIRDGGTASSDRYSIAAFRSIEYGNQPSEEEIVTAWNEVEIALSNLFEMEQVREALKGATRLVAQRPLQFELSNVNVRAVPDVIAFYDEFPPLIVDWKVHAFGTLDYRLQLALYALALVRCAPHRDFPEMLGTFAPTDIRLFEVQLLTKREHEYKLTEEDFEDLEDYIAASGREIQLATGSVKNRYLLPEDFAVTNQPELCQRCAFLKLCWEQPNGRP